MPVAAALVALSVLDAPRPALGEPTAPRSRQGAVANSAPQGPLQTAVACRAEPECVIAVMGPRCGVGQTCTAVELEMLVSAYRSTRREREMLATMRNYLARFPEGRRAHTYRSLRAERAPAPRR